MSFQDKKYLAPLLLLWAVLFFGHSWEAAPKMDAMTYGALAKNVLKTGDWTRLHYTPSSYGDYFQHPPLAIWMQAVVFKLVGASNITLKILPGLMALGTLLLVYGWAALAGGSMVGFFAGLILLSSTRFIKYGADFYLDGPLAFWLLLGGFAALMMAGDRRRLWDGVLGISVAAAFLTKGLPSLVLPASVGGLAVATRERRYLVGLGVGAGLVGIWLLFLDGAHYFAQYWANSVQGRMGHSGHGGGNWAALQNLWRTYWPWLPVFGWGLWCWWKTPRRFSTPQGLAAVSSLGILTAFTLTGNFLEHYLVIFYPFAAIVAAIPLAKHQRKFFHRWHQGVKVIALGLAIALATLPIHVHRRANDPLEATLDRALRSCQGADEIMITTGSAGAWTALAFALWKTPWEARWVEPTVAPHQARLLISTAAEKTRPGWTHVASVGPQVLWQARGASLCR